MSRNTVNTTVSVDPADALFLEWTSSINASGLFREAVAEQMEYRGIDRDKLGTFVEEALSEEHTDLEDLVTQTSSMEDLEALLTDRSETAPSTTDD